MKTQKVVRSLLLSSFLFTGFVWAGPVAKISALSPKYNAEEIEITWETSLAGGCEFSNVAVTNPFAANHRHLVAALFTAFARGSNVEVVFGGGCGATNSNWIQTIKIVH